MSYNWQKSSYSPRAANCVNVARAADGSVKLRESDDPSVIVTTTPQGLRALIAAVKAGKFDHLGG